MKKSITWKTFLSLTAICLLTILAVACSGNHNRNATNSEPARQPAPPSLPPDTPVPALCVNPYYPVSPTLKRQYRNTYTDTRLNTTYTETYTNIAADSFTYHFNFSNGSSQTNGFKCTAEGLATVEFAQVNSGGDQANAVKFQTLKATGVTIPAPDKWVKGYKWTSSYEVEGKFPMGDAKGNITIANEIVGEENVTVPAGTYKAFKVEANIVQKMMASEGAGKPLTIPIDGSIKVVNWYAKDVGMVKTSVEGLSTVELLSFVK
ncbi:MAG: hypothetical protein AB1757_01325 [Acidobacteriota bacterium]